jgi:hypothetical protein
MADREEGSSGAGTGGFITAAGTVLVVVLGLGFVFVITIVSLATVPGSQKAAVVTSGFTVLGTIVGAYFGIKAGAAGKDRAEAARDAEALKVQELAARTDPATAQAALNAAAERVATGTRTAGRTGGI